MGNTIIFLHILISKFKFVCVTNHNKLTRTISCNQYQNLKLLNLNKKIVDISVSEKKLILELKNGIKQEFLITDLVKIYIKIKKRSKFIYVVIFGISSIVSYLYSDTNWLFLIIFLYASLLFLIINNITHHKFKFKIIIKDSNLEIHNFKFDYQLKNKIVESLSRIRNQIKS